MTQIFANRPELMPVGETTQEHKRWQEEEAALVEKDRAAVGHKGGLFRGCFRLTRRRQLAVIRDDEDGVDRCPRCTWELEDGLCESCGYPAGEDSAEMSDSDGHGPWHDHLYDMEGATVEEFVEALGEPDRTGRRIPNLDFSEHGYSSEAGSSEGTAPQRRHRERRINEQLNRLPVPPEQEPAYDSYLDGTDENSDDEEDGSLDGFIVNDVENGPHSVTSSTRSLHWDTDEGTDGEGNLPENSDNDRESQDEDGYNELSFATARYETEDDSDEGPILRSRRQVRQRSVASDLSSEVVGSRGSGVSQALNALRVRNPWSGSHLSANSQRTVDHGNTDEGVEESTEGPIEIESDSDSPVPTQHTRRRRRAIQNRPLLDDDSDVEASSGTATVGRESPGAMAGWINTRNGPARPARRTTQTDNAPSPISIESSPTRSVDRQLAVPEAYPQRSRPTMPRNSLSTNNAWNASGAPNRVKPREQNSHGDISPIRSSPNASPSNGQQQRRGTRRRSPFPPRNHPQSPTSRQSHSPTAMEMFEQGRRDRQAQKNERRVERRRLKAERELRGRPQSGPSLSPGSSNQ